MMNPSVRLLQSYALGQAAIFFNIASEGLKHCVFEVSLADLQGDENHAFRKIRLRAEDVQGKNVLTNFWVLRNGRLLSQYFVESDSRIRTIPEECVPETTEFQDSSFGEHETELVWLPKIIGDFILPAGFPDSVSDDYLDYILLQFPTNVRVDLSHADYFKSFKCARMFLEIFSYFTFIYFSFNFVQPSFVMRVLLI